MENLTNSKYTHGGVLGHALRRVIHLSLVLVPFLYYYFDPLFTHVFGISLSWLLVAVLILTVMLEMLRLAFGFVVFGQRQHEARQVSSFAWGMMSVVLVLLLSPDKQYAIPIIASCALVDPLVGELRILQWPKAAVFVAGMLAVMLIWSLASVYLQTPWWWVLVMGPLTIVAEWPNLKWIDDNAMMQLIPLFVVLAVV